MRALICLLLGGVTLAQTSPDTQSTTASSLVSQASLQAILQQRQALFQQQQTLRAQGAGTQALQTWRQQHAAQFTSLNQQLQAWSASQPQRAMPVIQEISVPENATPEMVQFLTNQAQLANSRAQLHNQALTAGNAALLQRQQQLAQVIAQQQAQTPMKVPPATPIIPANASPQLKAFLTARYQLMREEIQTRNQYATADPATRQAAMQQWRQQNAAQFQQLQQQAQALAQTQSTTQN
jgi:hypothetical protein